MIRYIFSKLDMCQHQWVTQSFLPSILYLKHLHMIKFEDLNDFKLRYYQTFKYTLMLIQHQTEIEEIIRAIAFTRLQNYTNMYNR